MKRVLLLGLSPLPTENETHTLGPGKRTWQFARSLLQEGHRVCLICSRHLAAYKTQKSNPIIAEEHGNLIYYSLDQEVFENISWIQMIHDRFDPDCIVGATVYPSYIACKLRTDRPIWADLFGHIMAEAQTKSLVFQDDYYLAQMWKLEKTVLDRADIFSVVSTPQAHATIGELGTRGRLNSATTGYSFIRVIPCATNDMSTIRIDSDKRLLRGKYVDDDDFVILWSGGYNTWTDVGTLFKSLESVFEGNPKMKFVSTGGQITSHDELTYTHFLNMIENSKFKDRYIMRGWIPFHEVPHYWNESDVGINIDLFTYEAILGSRNRILDWMQSELPVLTTELCELTQTINQKKLGFTFKPENAKELSELLLNLAKHPSLLMETSKRAKEYVDRDLTIEKTTEPLSDWLVNPDKAPDHEIVKVYQSNILDSANRTSLHYLATFRNYIRSFGLMGTIKRLFNRYL